MIRTLLQTSIRFLIGPGGRMLVVFGVVAAAWALWAYVPLRPLASWYMPDDDTTWHCVSPDGSTLVTIASRTRRVGSSVFSDGFVGPVRLWDLPSGRERGNITISEFPLIRTTHAASIAPDGSWLLTISQHGGVTLWDPSTGVRRAELRPPNEPGINITHFFNVQTSIDGRFIAANRLDGQAVRVWDGMTGRLVSEILGARAPSAFTPDGHRLLTATPEADGTTGTSAKLWDLETGREVLNLPGHRWPVGAVAVSPDGRVLATGLRTSGRRNDDPHDPVEAKLWDAVSGRLLATLEVADRPYGASSFEFSPDGRLLVMRGGRGRGLVWDITAMPPQNRDDLIAATEGPFGGTTCLQAIDSPTFAPNGRACFVAGSNQGRFIGVADDSTGTPRPLVLPELLGVDTYKAINQHPVFGPGGRTLAVPVSAGVPRYASSLRGLLDRILHRSTGTETRSVVRLYDPATGHDLGTLPDVSGEYHVLTFTPDGETFWTERLERTSTWRVSGETRVFEQWPVPSPGVPSWLLSVTAIGVVLIAADIWRLRRRRAARRSHELEASVGG